MSVVLLLEDQISTYRNLLLTFLNDRPTISGLLVTYTGKIYNGKTVRIKMGSKAERY